MLVGSKISGAGRIWLSCSFTVIVAEVTVTLG